MREAAIRRLTSRLGSLYGDPLYGYDLQQMLSESGVPSTIASTASARVRQQLLRDERVNQVRITESRYDLPTQTLTLALTATTGEGPFELVLELSPGNIDVITGASY